MIDRLIAFLVLLFARGKRRRSAPRDRLVPEAPPQGRWELVAAALWMHLEPARQRGVGRLIRVAGEHPLPAERVNDEFRGEIAAVGVDEAVFGAAAEAGDACSREPLTQILRKGAAQVGAAGFDAGDAPALEHAREAADGRLDFGKFGHAGDMADAARAR